MIHLRLACFVPPFGTSRAARAVSVTLLGSLLSCFVDCSATVSGSNPPETGGGTAAGGAPSGSGGTGVNGGTTAAGQSAGAAAAGTGASAGVAAAGTGGLSSGGSNSAGGGSGGSGGSGGVVVSGGSGGSGGRGGGSGGQGGAPPSCAASHYLICEDFEATAEGATPTGWTKQGDIQVATDDAYRSAHSLKVFVTAGKAENYRSISMNPSMLGTGHWGRVYYKVQAPVPAYFAHDTFVSLTGDGPDAAFKNENVRVVDTVHNADQSHQFLYNVQPSGGEFGKGSPYPYTFKDGGWHCAEWQIDNPTQNFHFYYDGTEVTSIAVTNGAGKFQGSEIPAAFSKLTVGVAQYQSPGNGSTMMPLWFTAWFDDLALDVNRIGCN